MLEMLINAIEELDEEKVLKIVKRCVAAGTPPKDIWMALNKGLEKVGLRYESGEYSIADLMVVGIIFENVLEYTNMCDIYDSIEARRRESCEKLQAFHQPGRREVDRD